MLFEPTLERLKRGGALRKYSERKYLHPVDEVYYTLEDQDNGLTFIISDTEILRWKLALDMDEEDIPRILALEGRKKGYSVYHTVLYMRMEGEEFPNCEPPETPSQEPPRFIAAGELNSPMGSYLRGKEAPEVVEP